jgi:hypothetical protein
MLHHMRVSQERFNIKWQRVSKTFFHVAITFLPLLFFSPITIALLFTAITVFPLLLFSFYWYSAILAIYATNWCSSKEKVTILAHQ